ncbi:hypothetical protein PR202_gb03455 [Eleusine coracana subsp. coracana]|uniref:Uncharacterized protein n=1 Tax=Eleusine coracana subsp. coracana TaxID=191504 RepID=A0AAV5E2X7_ELECO|nr:hypothetical protein PR202_gb03455 [Eleusine coracana subsp. coracana]
MAARAPLASRGHPVASPPRPSHPTTSPWPSPPLCVAARPILRRRLRISDVSRHCRQPPHDAILPPRRARCRFLALASSQRRARNVASSVTIAAASVRHRLRVEPRDLLLSAPLPARRSTAASPWSHPLRPESRRHCPSSLWPRRRASALVRAARPALAKPAGLA